MLKNSQHQYGWVSITLHWFMALAFIAMYFVGDWMVELDYYDSWYHRAPHLHKSVGIVLVALMVIRFVWNKSQPKPEEQGSNRWMNRFAWLGHQGFYLFVLLLFISGYLISTAKGKGIDVFDWFQVPALLAESKDRGDLAGDIHELLANLFILMALGHALAALYHHFIVKDYTLKRMFGKSTKPSINHGENT